jgi:hypothetical protein
MNMELSALAAAYRETRQEPDPRKALAHLAETYHQARETALLDLVSSVTASYGILLADRIDVSRVDEQMLKALDLAYVGKSLEDLAAMPLADRAGALNGWKGKYFEILVRDELNAGQSIGDLTLLPGQEARLAAAVTQPGWDLEIVGPDGSGLEIFQLKATESLSYVQRALDKYPDIPVIATDEVGGLVAEIAPSGISDSELEAKLAAPFAALVDSPAIDITEEVLPFLPFVLICIGEGRHVIAGRKTFARALRSSGVRSAKAGAAIGAGAMVFALDGGWLSLPATALTRLAIARHDNHSRAQVMLETRHHEATALLPAYA